MKAYDSKSYLSYLNKLVDQYNNTYHRSIGKELTNADYLLWLKKLRLILKLLSLKLMIKSELLSILRLHRKLVQENIYYWFGFENWSLDI